MIRADGGSGKRRSGKGDKSHFGQAATAPPTTYAPPQPSPTIPDPATQVVYNLDREIEQIVRPDGQTVVFDYGETDGRLQSVSVDSDVRNYTYYTAVGKRG